MFEIEKKGGQRRLGASRTVATWEVRGDELYIKFAQGFGRYPIIINVTEK